MTPPGYRRQWRWYRARGSERVVTREEFEALPLHGRAALAEEFEALPLHGRAALAEVMARWANGGVVLPREIKALKDTDGLWELRVNVGNDPFRLIFFADSPVHDVIVLAIFKNQEKLPGGTSTARHGAVTSGGSTAGADSTTVRSDTDRWTPVVESASEWQDIGLDRYPGRAMGVSHERTS